ncbi:MAG: 4Fe-4S binding protein [Syntrophales bacterium]|jgi:Pyruvate/2-oxoacid:ferredoxin oxidoreductase delta subunit
MARDIYKKLAEHLDNLPGGFPRTTSGVEIRILHRLFVPDEAKLAVHLTLIPEEPRIIARRAKVPVEDAAQILEAMNKKGLVIGMQRKGQPLQYMAQQFIVGFWEAQVNKLSRELVEEFEEYLPSLFDPGAWRKAPQMRTIPVEKSITVQPEVMPYERAEELVRNNTTFAVSNCICRQEFRILGKGCDKPEESCLQFGLAAEGVVHMGRGRAITREEALAILRRAEETGLVLQPANSKNPLFICTCCGCCCGVLRLLKRDPKPASLVASPFVASLDLDTCKGCGICTKRCQMEAIHVDNKKAILDPERCIGCGLCVDTCRTKSLTLLRKPEAQQSYVPRNIIETSIKLGKARGKLGIGRLVGMQVKSKLDRLLAQR